MHHNHADAQERAARQDEGQLRRARGRRHVAVEVRAQGVREGDQAGAAGEERDVEPVMSSPKISPQPENGLLLVMIIEGRSDRRETDAEFAIAVLLDATVVRTILLPATMAW